MRLGIVEATRTGRQLGAVFAQGIVAVSIDHTGNGKYRLRHKKISVEMLGGRLFLFWTTPSHF